MNTSTSSRGLTNPTTPNDNIPIADSRRAGPDGEDSHLMGGRPDTPLLCRNGNELSAQLLDGSILRDEKLVELSEPEIHVAVQELAKLAADASGDRLRSPESWAAEFLHLSMDDAEGYFLRARTNAYSRKGHAYSALVRAAAAYAWVLRKRDPQYAAPGSMRASMSHLTSAQVGTYVANSSRYQAHSFEIEGERVSASAIQTALQALLSPRAQA